MFRRLFTLCSALSLLLCVAACVLWMRSYWLTDQIIWRRLDGERMVRSAQGNVVVKLYQSRWAGSPAGMDGAPYGVQYRRFEAFEAVEEFFAREDARDVERGFTCVHREWRGFTWHTMRTKDHSILSVIAIAPFLSLALVTAALPLGWTAMRMRSFICECRRKRVGLCPICGYDLCATPDRCPECGTTAQQPA